jgi:CHAT domain-containing protein
MGQFSLLPLHAAGIYDKTWKTIDCVSEYVISSYTPSISALCKARKRPPPTLSSGATLLLAQPTTPGFTSLPKTLEEVRAIARIVPTSSNHISLLEDTTMPNTREGGIYINLPLDAAVRLLAQAENVHFACHGQQDSVNSLKSGFQLENGRLTVAHMMAIAPANPCFAFLSACQSAAGDSSLPDEYLNLAASM